MPYKQRHLNSGYTIKLRRQIKTLARYSSFRFPKDVGRRNADVVRQIDQRLSGVLAVAPKAQGVFSAHTQNLTHGENHRK